MGLGSSVGDRRATVEIAIRKLALQPGLQLLRCSRLYRTPPMRGGSAKGWFLNGAALFDTTLTPEDLLSLCASLEQQAGRRRALHWGDRTLDLDLLVMENTRRDSPTLQLPHPAIAQRPFVLLPLLDVWPNAIDQRTGEMWKNTHGTARPRAIPIGVVAYTPKSLYLHPSPHTGRLA